MTPEAMATLSDDAIVGLPPQFAASTTRTEGHDPDQNYLRLFMPLNGLTLSELQGT